MAPAIWYFFPFLTSDKVSGKCSAGLRQGISLPRSGIQFVRVALLAALLATRGLSQSAAGDHKPTSATPANIAPAIVTGVRVVHERGVPALEVVSSHPVVPTIQALDSPPRLVIDLPNARMGLQRKRISVQQENILTIRAEQYQIKPPVTRIVLDLLVPYGYTWEEATGNRLVVRLKPPEDPDAASKKAPSQLPKELSLSQDSVPAVVPVTSGLGEVVLAGSRFAAGQSLTAGSETALLHLSRGGEVRVCPGTTLSITPSKTKKDLMFGMSTGALETHYALDTSADTVLTPDFRILFAGPGEFHYAVSTDSHGNTCVRGLRGNTSSAIVSELMGDRIYQVRPAEQAVFHSGRIDKVDTDVPLECGCPPPVPAVRTDTNPEVIPDSAIPTNIGLARKDAPAPPAAEGQDDPRNRELRKDDGAHNAVRQTLSSGTEVQPLPPTLPNEVHIQVDAPLVFHGNKTFTDPPAPAEEAAALPLMTPPARLVLLDEQVRPPAATAEEIGTEHHRVLRRIKGFFAAIFR